MLFSHPLIQQATTASDARPGAAYGDLFREPESPAGDLGHDFGPDLEPEYPRAPARPRRGEIRARRAPRRRAA